MLNLKPNFNVKVPQFFYLKLNFVSSLMRVESWLIYCKNSIESLSFLDKNHFHLQCYKKLFNSINY